MSRFHRLCSCSLLHIRPHPVISATDWLRHIQAQEQDRLNQLFPDPPTPENPDQESSSQESGGRSQGRGYESSIASCEAHYDDSSEGEGSPQENEDEHPSKAESENSTSTTSSPSSGRQNEDSLDSLENESEESNEDPLSPTPDYLMKCASPPLIDPWSSQDEDVEHLSDLDNFSQVLHEGSDEGSSTLAAASGNCASPSLPGPAYRYSDDSSSPLPVWGDMPGDSTSPDYGPAISSRDDSPPLRQGTTYDGRSDEEVRYQTNQPLDAIEESAGRLSCDIDGMMSASLQLDHGDLDLHTIGLADGDNSGDESSYDEILHESHAATDEDSDKTQFSEEHASDRAGRMKQGFFDEPIVDDIWGSSGEDDVSTPASISSDGSESFDYGQAANALKKQEILSVAIHDIKLSHRLSRAASSDVTELLECFAEDVSCWDYRTTRKWIEKRTGVKAISYDCCIKSCMSFTMYPEKDKCDYCDLPRWKTQRDSQKRIPFATHEYIPFTHRLKLWWADPKRAATMIKYRKQAEAQENHTDYWTSELFRELKVKGLFRRNTDLGFLLTTDGVQIYKARAKFSIWPIALECLNLPPTIRAKRQNMLCTGFIPGPKGPKNLDSFLFPLIKEFEELQNGVRVLNGSLSSWLPEHDRRFTLKGHICLVGADMIAREKIMKVTGNRSYCYCEYCLVQGVWNRGIYCPITPPSDAPLEAQKRKGSGYPWTSWDRQCLPMRNDREFRLVGERIARKGATAKQKSKYGIKGLSILSRLSSIDFPRSFPPDSMHLWFENIVPDLVKQWRGKYKVDVEEDDGVEADNELSSDESNAPRTSPAKVTSKKRKSRKQPTGSVKKRKGLPTSTIKPKDLKVVATDDDYNINSVAWEKMSSEIAASAPNFPTLFGPLLRNFLEYINQMTASEWQLFTFILGPVYLKGVLPDGDYEEFISLVEAIQLSCDYVLTPEDFIEMDQRINRFSIYYERRYYRMEWARLRSCLPVFHQILHVPQALRWAGPMYAYSQWAMERFCGTLAGVAKSRVSTNRNISNSLTMIEQKNTLVYVMDCGAPDSTEDEDSDGNILLSKFLTKRLRKSHPPNGGAFHGSGELHPVAKEREIDKLLFCGPSKVYAMKAYERMCLKAFFFNELIDINADHDIYYNSDDREADCFDIPTHCRLYRSATFNTGCRGDFYPFKSTSSTDVRSNQSRSTSFVRFEVPPSKSGGERESHFGEVLFYFTVELPDNCGYAKLVASPGDVYLQLRERERGLIRESKDNELLLAYVRDFPVCRDGRLLYCKAKGVKRVIMASDIHELIGLLKKGRREYIVRKDNAFF